MRVLCRNKRKWDLNGDTDKDDSNDCSKGPNSKKLREALKRAREHALQISSHISKLQQKPQTEDKDVSLQKSMIESDMEIIFKPNLSRDEFSTTIEINDVKNRYLITKGTTQVKIRQETGAE